MLEMNVKSLKRDAVGVNETYSSESRTIRKVCHGEKGGGARFSAKNPSTGCPMSTSVSPVLTTAGNAGLRHSVQLSMKRIKVGKTDQQPPPPPPIPNSILQY